MKTQLVWLCYKITQSGILPLANKTAEIQRLRTNKSKKFRVMLSFSASSWKACSNFVPILSPVTPLLNKH